MGTTMRGIGRRCAATFVAVALGAGGIVGVVSAAVVVGTAAPAVAGQARTSGQGINSANEGGNIAIGDLYACAIASSGGVKCWGNGTGNRLGNGGTANSSTPVDVAGLGGAAISISADKQGGTCALLADGTVKCWGNSTGFFAGLTGANMISLGYDHDCVLVTGAVKCLGVNDKGQLGDGTTTNSGTPVTVSGITGAIAISAGWKDTCAVMSSGAVKCWGYNHYGELGDGTTTDRATPVDVSGVIAQGIGTSRVEVASTCALTNTDGVKCWGSGVKTPVDVPGLRSGVAMIAMKGQNCAVTYGGALKCGFDTDTPPATQAGLSTGIIGVGLGEGAVGSPFGDDCALTSAGAVKCWGSNGSGQLGNGTTTNSTTPVVVSGLEGANPTIDQTLAFTSSRPARPLSGQTYTAVATSTSTLNPAVWIDPASTAGACSTGTPTISSGTTSVVVAFTGNGTCIINADQVGDETHKPAAEVVQTVTVGASLPLKAAPPIATGAFHACSLTGAGGVKCWGRNDKGELGDGTTTDSNVARSAGVTGLSSGVVAIAAGSQHTCALTSAGAVKCWGENGAGQLGNGGTANSTTPVSVSGLGSGVAAISVGSAHTCALTTAGAMKCWGANGSGALGNGTTTGASTPVSVSGLGSGVAAIAAGYGHSCALLSTGLVKCWGSNGSGQLGDGTFTDRTTPVDVGGLISVTDVTAGLDHTCALTAAGGMKCWGINDKGQLGDGTTTYRTSPVNVSGLTSGVAAIVAGVYIPVTCALTAAGGAKCWGEGTLGALGNGSTADTSTPVDVSGLTSGVTALATSGYHSCAVTAAGGIKCWGYGAYGELGIGSLGTSNFTTAPSSNVIFVAAQTISITSTAPTAAVYGGSYTPTATATSGLPVTFSIDPTSSAVCSMSGSNVSFTGVGSCKVDADQAGNTSYDSAPRVQQTFSIAKATLAVTPAAQSKTYGDADPTFTFTVSGLKFSDTQASLDTPPTCSVSGTHTNVGSYTISCSGGSDTNYLFTTTATANLTINKATLTVTPADKAKAYGDTDPPFTFTLSGFKGTDTATGIDTQPACSVPAAHTSVGTYTITCSGGLDNNYLFNTAATAALTVAKAVLTVTPAAKSKVYGDADPVFTFTLTGFKGTDTQSVINSLPTCSVSGAHVNVGTFPISCTGGTDDSYAFDTTATALLTITKAALTVTVNDASKVYGTANPAFSVAYSGFKNGDTASALGGTLAYATTAGPGSGAGMYAVTPSGLTSSNYTITFVAGALHVTPAPLTVTANNASRSYGAADPAFSVNYAGFVNGDTASALGGTLAIATAATSTSSPGTYAITPSGVTSTNYTITFVNGTLTIAKAVATILPDPKSKVYGAADPNPFTFTVTGLQNGETAAVFDTQPTCGVTGAHATVGTYTISCSGGTDANYTLDVTHTALLSITKAVLAVDAVAKSKVYGAADPVLTWTYSGFQNGDLSPAGLTGTASCSRATGESVGNYTITCLPGTLAATNYTFVKGATPSLAITKAVLAVNAQAKSKVYGATDPAFTWTYSGFQNGDTSPAGLAGAASCTRSAGENAGGSYPITCAPGTLAATNYSFATGATAALSIAKVLLVVTPDPQTKVYGAADPTFTRSITGFVNGETEAVLDVKPTCGVTPAHVNVGPYPISCAGGTDGNYAFDQSATATLTITKKLLTVTPDPQSKVYGAADPTFTRTITGFVTGETEAVLDIPPSCSAAGVHTSVGSYTIACSGGADGNYSFDQTATAVLTITKALLTVTPGAQSKVYGAADPAFTRTVTGFVNGETEAALDVKPVCSVAGGHTSAGTYPITCSGGSDVNYAFDQTATAVLTVAKALLTVTPDPQSKVYGSADPAFARSVTGFVSGETEAALDVKPACGVTPAHTNVGTYPITCSGGSDANYAFDQTATAVLTITKALLTVTPAAQSKVYGSADPAFTRSITGFVSGETESVLDAKPACGVAAAHVNVGSFPITCSGGVDANYSFDQTATALLTITKRLLTVTPDSQTKVYGAAEPALTRTVTGFVNGETEAVLDTKPVCSVAGGHTNVGTYPIACAGGADGNYSFDQTAAAVLTITKALLTVTPASQTKVYGAADPTFTRTVTGFVNAETEAVLDTKPVCSVAGAHDNVGTYVIACSGGSDANYSFDQTATALLSVTKKLLTVAPAAQTKVYGAADPAFTRTVTGFVNGETEAVLDTKPACSVAGLHANVGTYVIACAGGTDANYSFDQTATALLTITKALLTVTPDPQAKVYGDADPLFTRTVTGFANSETEAVLDAKPACGVAAAHVNAGPYTIACSGGSDANYSFDQTATALLTITKATLAVTPDAQHTVFGQADPVFTFALSGFKNSDTSSSLTAQPTCSVAGAHTAVGSYSITCAAGSATNYAFDVTRTAMLTIAKASTSNALTSSVNPSVFGQPVTLTALIAAVAPGAGHPSDLVAFFDGSTLLGTAAVNATTGKAVLPLGVLSVGSHSFAAHYGGDASFLASNSTTIGQVVNKASTATALTASPAPAQFGQAVTLTATVAAVAPGVGHPSGSVTFTDGSTTLGTAPVDGTTGKAVLTTATNALSVGTHPVKASYSGDGNFVVSTKTLNVVVNKATTTLVAANASRVHPTFAATLTRTWDHTALVGKVINFIIGGNTVCSAVTDNDGRAACTPTVGVSIATQNYTAKFAGDVGYVAASATGKFT